MLGRRFGSERMEEVLAETLVSEARDRVRSGCGPGVEKLVKIENSRPV